MSISLNSPWFLFTRKHICLLTKIFHQQVHRYQHYKVIILPVCLSVHICVSSQLPYDQNQAIFSKKKSFSVFQRHQHQRYSGSDVKISLCSSYGAADRGSRWCWMPQLLSRLSFPGASSPPYDEESQDTVAALPRKMTARFIRIVQ